MALDLVYLSVFDVYQSISTQIQLFLVSYIKGPTIESIVVPCF